MRRRISAQIDGLNWALAQVKDTPGDTLELGLGNGRTYDHLREYGDGRRIWVVDRQLNCHHTCVPPQEDYLEGEADAMMQRLHQNGHRIALAHYELGIGVRPKDEEEAARLSPFLVQLMVPGGIIVSQQPIMGVPQIGGPDTIAKDRYLFYLAPVA